MIALRTPQKIVIDHERPLWNKGQRIAGSENIELLEVSVSYHRKLIALMIFAIIVTSQVAWAKMYQWKDDSGKVHYTDDLGAIPPRFRIQIEIPFTEDDEGDSGETSGQTPLYRAVISGDMESIEWLISEGADVGTFDSEGTTPLHLAVHRGELELVKLLVEHGADPDAKDQYGLTPMQIAVDEKKSYLFHILVKKQAESPSTKTKNTKTDQPSSYDEIARATGGAVYQFEEDMKGASDVLIATVGSDIILSQVFDLSKASRLIEVSLDPSVTTVLFTVTAVKGKPSAKVTDPKGLSLKKYQVLHPGEVKVVSLKNGEAIIVKNPEPGTWKLDVNGTGNMHVKVDVKPGSQGKVSNFYEFEFVELQGRPGHQGYFPTFRPLVSGQSMMAVATLFDSPEDVSIQFIKRNGEPYKGYGGAMNVGHSGPTRYYGSFRIPPASFQVVMRGKDTNGNTVRRLYHTAFEVDRRVASFNFKDQASPEECARAQWLLGLPLSKQKLTRDMKAKELAIVSCPLESRQMRYDIELDIYSLIPSAGKTRSVRLVSDERMRFDAEKCHQAAELLQRFDNRLKLKKAGVSVAWKAYCEDQGIESQLIFEATVQSN